MRTIYAVRKKKRSASANRSVAIASGVRPSMRLASIPTAFPELSDLAARGNVLKIGQVPASRTRRAISTKQGSLSKNLDSLTTLLRRALGEPGCS